MAAPNLMGADTPPSEIGSGIAATASFDPAAVATTSPGTEAIGVMATGDAVNGGGERGGEPRRGRRRGRRGRRGGGPRDAAAAGDAAFTPGEPDPAGESDPGDEEGANEAAASDVATNGHAGNGADLPFPEPPRTEGRSGAISWTGLAAPEAPAARAPDSIVVEAPVASQSPASLEGEALEDSGIDTAKLPQLETADETPALDAAIAAIDEDANRAAASPAAEVPTPDWAAQPAPTPAPPPARVVWSSGPAAPTQDRGRED